MNTLLPQHVIRYQKGTIPDSLHSPCETSFSKDGHICAPNLKDFLDDHKYQVKVVVDSNNTHSGEVCVHTLRDPCITLLSFDWSVWIYYTLCPSLLWLRIVFPCCSLRLNWWHSAIPRSATFTRGCLSSAAPIYSLYRVLTCEGKLQQVLYKGRVDNSISIITKVKCMTTPYTL